MSLNMMNKQVFNKIWRDEGIPIETLAPQINSMIKLHKHGYSILTATKIFDILIATIKDMSNFAPNLV